MLLFLPVLITGLSGCVAEERREHPSREQHVGKAGRYMVAAAEPHAVKAGLEMLRRGGNAVDAAVAVQMALSFTEPAESSIGGGGFLLFRDGESGKMVVYDGRETAPRSAAPDRFLLPGGIRMPFWLAVVSGRSVGVPGVPAMLHLAHQRHGKLAWAELFGPAIAMAESGIPMPSRLRHQVAGDPSLWLFSGTRQTFAARIRSGEQMLVNSELGRTLRIIARDGPEPLYQGALAGEIVTAVNGRWIFPGDLTMADLGSYRPEERHALCRNYRSWTVCSIPPPSSGGVAVLQILGMLEHFPLPEMEPDSMAAVHFFAEASRLAYADLQDRVGDPAYEDIPLEELLGEDYLAERAGLIDRTAARSQVSPGVRRGGAATAGPAGAGSFRGSTTHFSIVDGEGNAVAMTSSIEVPFGSRIMVGGFLLNNQLTDFSFRPCRDGRKSANAAAPGKRPRSWMSPTVVLDGKGEIRLLIGSRGGAAIPAYVAKTIVGVLDWNLPLQEAIALPNIVARGPVLLLEEETSLAAMAGELRKMGHQVELRALVSGLHGIERKGEYWRGGSDPRLAGAAVGE